MPSPPTDSNFVYSGVAAPAAKVNANPVVDPIDEVWDDTAANFTLTGLTDIRAVILSATNIMAYGADPTGAVDSSGALIAAYTALGTGILHLPEGTYRISSNVTVPGTVDLAFDSSGFSVDSGKTLIVLGSILPPYAMPQVNPGPVSPVFVRPRQYWGSSATGPTDGGTYVAGDLYWLLTPSAGGNMGLVCTAGGTPGTWKQFGVVSP